MNITLNTNNFSSQQSNRINNNYKNKNLYKQISNNNQPSFSGIEIPTKSKVLTPFHRAMDNLTSWISKNYTEKLYTSKFAGYLAKKADKLSSVVDHMQVMGSVIISGMYMTETLRNKQLDEDRRRTLAINQGLTFAVSTAGSYIIDDMLDSKWEKLTTKYAAKEIGDDKLAEKIEKINQKLKAEFDAKNVNGASKGKAAKFKPMSVLKYIEDHQPNTTLEKRLRGMGVLKKLVVFGTVYRFLAPVLVTPIASSLGEKYIKNKKEKEAQPKPNLDVKNA